MKVLTLWNGTGGSLNFLILINHSKEISTKMLDVTLQFFSHCKRMCFQVFSIVLNISLFLVKFTSGDLPTKDHMQALFKFSYRFQNKNFHLCKVLSYLRITWKSTHWPVKQFMHRHNILQHNSLFSLSSSSGF